jgi:hypothetical protein
MIGFEAETARRLDEVKLWKTKILAHIDPGLGHFRATRRERGIETF